MSLIITAIWGFAKPFLEKYWLQIGTALVVGILVLTLHFKNEKIVTLNKEVTAITAELTQAKTELQNCRDNINSQNLAIDDAAKKTQTDQKQMDGLNTTIATLKQQQTKTLQQMKSAPIPKTCNDAVTYLKNGIGDLSWSK